MNKIFSVIASTALLIGTSASAYAQTDGHIYTTANPMGFSFSGWAQLGPVNCSSFTLTGDLVETHSPGHSSGGVPGYNKLINITGDNTGSTNPFCAFIDVVDGEATIYGDGRIEVENLEIIGCDGLNTGRFDATAVNVPSPYVTVEVDTLTDCGTIAAEITSNEEAWIDE